MGETLSVRIPDELVERLERLASDTGVSRADLLRDVLQRGLQARSLDHALDLYRRREVSFGRGAMLSGLAPGAFLDHVRRHGLLIHYEAEDLEEDLRWAKEA